MSIGIGALVQKLPSTIQSAVRRIAGYLLQEDGSYILLENGYQIKLQG
jgi:hypothetical protein